LSRNFDCLRCEASFQMCGCSGKLLIAEKFGLRFILKQPQIVQINLFGVLCLVKPHRVDLTNPLAPTNLFNIFQLVAFIQNPFVLSSVL